MITLGALGFHHFENSDWLDSVYNATQTVTTVGYGDLPPKTRAGKLFAVFFMLFGVGTVLYALTVLAQAVIQSDIIETMDLRRKTREINKLKNHFIVCGAGRVGRRIIRQLQKQNLPFVLIEKDEKKIVEFEDEGAHILVEDATLEENLNDYWQSKYGSRPSETGDCRFYGFDCRGNTRPGLVETFFLLLKSRLYSLIYL